MRPEPKRVLITGAGSGIGRALAIEAARRGLQVALCGRRPETLDATLRELAGTGHWALAADVTDASGRRAIVESVMRHWAALDVLVNNAGLVEGGALEDLDDAALARIFDTNVIGPIALTRDLMPMLERAQPSRVVNVGSVFGDIPYPLFASYSASKFALRGFSTALRREWKGRGIGVTYVAPRATRTAALASVEAHMPQAAGRSDSPEIVARLVWRAIESGASSVYAPGPERLFVLLQRTFPGLIDRALSRPASSSA